MHEYTIFKYFPLHKFSSMSKVSKKWLKEDERRGVERGSFGKTGKGGEGNGEGRNVRI